MKQNEVSNQYYVSFKYLHLRLESVNTTNKNIRNNVLHRLQLTISSDKEVTLLVMKEFRSG